MAIILLPNGELKFGHRGLYAGSRRVPTETIKRELGNNFTLMTSRLSVIDAPVKDIDFGAALSTTIYADRVLQRDSFQDALPKTPSFRSS